MRTIKHLAPLAVAAVAVVAAPVHAKEAVIGLSPFGTPEQKLEEIKAIAFHLASTVEPGERAWVIDAFSQEEVAVFAVPNDPERYKRIKSKMRANEAFFAKTKRFADAARLPEGEAFAGQINMPRLMRTIGANYPADTARDLIIYAASPLFDDPNIPGLTMKTGAVPDDAHIVASRANTVYGGQGEEDFLANYTVHWGALDAGFVRNDRHLHFMQRYYALAIAARGGVLTTFATNPETAILNAAAGLSAPVSKAALKPDDQPTMIFYHEIEAALEEASIGSIYERRLSDRTPTTAELTAAEDVEIAIRWACDCDFDLVVQPLGGAPISFRKLQTSQGKLFKDFTSSDALNRGWETVAMDGPIDLTQTLVAANLFRGPAGSEVELRVAIGGETWGWRFVLAGKADGGKGFATTVQRKAAANTAWTIADLAALMEGS